MVRIGIVGAGAWGRNHVRVCASDPGCTLVAVADPDPAALASIAAWAAEASPSPPNLRPPVALDARAADWPLEEADAVVCINMVHIAPWESACGLFTGAGRLLPAHGVLFLYGPYKRDGRHTAPSNEAFDQDLRRRNPAWGVRDLADVEKAASGCGLRLSQVVEMPANNLSVAFVR